MFVEPELLGALKRPEQPGEINFGHQTPLLGPPDPYSDDSAEGRLDRQGRCDR